MADVITPAQRALYRRIVDAAWNEATESETVPSTDWADRIIDRVVKDVPRCPACGSLAVPVCQLLGHVYPIRKCPHDRAPDECLRCIHD